MLNNLYQKFLAISVNKEKKYTYNCKINDQYQATAAKGRGYWGYQGYTEPNR
jgi:hypothetical protein